MKGKCPIVMAVALLLGAGIVPALPGRVGPTAAFAYGPRASDHVNAGTGLVRSVDANTDILVLDTPSGVQRVHVAQDAAIHDEHDDMLTLGQIKPGDAVSYELTSGAAIELHVTRQFWAIPREG
jgi:hypothetical protein